MTITDRRWAFGAPLLCASFLLVRGGCGGTSWAQSSAPAPIQVPVAPVERHDVTRSIRLAGSVEAVEQARLYAKVSGYLKTISVDIGDVVRRDQVVAELNVPEMQGESEAAEARLAEARALEAKAEADLELQKIIAERSRELRERGAVTQQDLDEAVAKQRAAAAALQLARARAKSAAAQLAKVRALADYARIKAPYDGIVTERFLNSGALVQAATSGASVSPVVTVARVDQVRVFVALPESDVPFVEAEDRAIFVPNGAKLATPFEGHVTRLAGALDPSTRTMRVEVDLPNAERRLLPGMYGSLTLALETHRGALTVPSRAVVTEKSGATFVYLVVDGAARRATVRVGIDDGIRAEITEGLEGGETCIVGAPGTISDGVPVRPIPPGAPEAKSS